jgi:hypothetical protein
MTEKGPNEGIRARAQDDGVPTTPDVSMRSEA